MIDVYIYENEHDREEGHAVEAWEDAPCAPRVGDLVYLRQFLGRGQKGRRVASVEWFNARERPPVRLHAYVVLEPTTVADKETSHG